MIKTSENKTNYKHTREGTQHNTNETRSRQLHHKHKTSNIFPVHTFKRIYEALFDKERVHDFPFGLIEISDRK
jgi:lysyl-tRNA synthetase class I